MEFSKGGGGRKAGVPNCRGRSSTGGSAARVVEPLLLRALPRQGEMEKRKNGNVEKKKWMKKRDEINPNVPSPHTPHTPHNSNSITDALVG